MLLFPSSSQSFSIFQIIVHLKNSTIRSVQHINNNTNIIYILYFNFCLFSELLFGTLFQQLQVVWLEQLYQLYNVCNSNNDDAHFVLTDKD